MRVSSLPANFGCHDLCEGLRHLNLPFDAHGDEDVTIDLTESAFCDPSGIIAIAAFGAHRLRTTKRRVSLEGWVPNSYLSRVGVQTALGHRDDYPHRRKDSDRLTSILEVPSERERAAVQPKVLDILDIRDPGARFALGYCLEEILRNVEDHADSPVNALLQAQYYPARSQVVVAIADTGYGMLQSLRQRYSQIDNDADSLKAALQPRVSGRNIRKGTNAGLGLTVCSRMVSRVGGTFIIASGDSIIEVTAGGTQLHSLGAAKWPGVLVTFCVPRDDSNSWEGTLRGVIGEL